MTTSDEQEFYTCADAFIQLANSQVSQTARSRVSAALMFASARYSAFNAKAAGVSDTEDAINHLVGEYRAMLTHNMTDTDLFAEE